MAVGRGCLRAAGVACPLQRMRTGAKGSTRDWQCRAQMSLLSWPSSRAKKQCAIHDLGGLDLRLGGLDLRLGGLGGQKNG